MCHPQSTYKTILLHFVSSFLRMITRQVWTLDPPNLLPQMASWGREVGERQRRRFSLLTWTSTWSPTCWSPSAVRPGWPDLPPTCCRVWAYTSHPMLILHKGKSSNDWGHIWQFSLLHVSCWWFPDRTVGETALKAVSNILSLHWLNFCCQNKRPVVLSV